MGSPSLWIHFGSYVYLMIKLSVLILYPVREQIFQLNYLFCKIKIAHVAI